MAEILIEKIDLMTGINKQTEIMTGMTKRLKNTKKIDIMIEMN